MTPRFLSRLTIFSTLLGVILFLAGITIQQNLSGFMGQAEQLMFFGVGVVVPLALRLAAQPNHYGQLDKVYSLIVGGQPLVTLAVGISLLTIGWQAGLLACVWFLQTLLIAIYGLRRLLSRPVIMIEENCIDAGLIYAPVSGIWFVAYAFGYPLLTFDPTFVLLTGVHFLYISLGALIITGLLGRQLYKTSGWKFYRRIAWSIIISPLVVGIGITTTQFTGHIAVEVLAVFILTSSFILMVLLGIFRASPPQRPARWLILLSGLTLLLTMSLALAYALGRFTGWWTLTLVDMIQWHGWFNALGFVFLGLLGWNLAAPTAHAPE